jgi:hypothetical protein
MFRMLKLSPPHGWRNVWWELGIVTLGVLIALGAEQLIQTLHGRHRVGIFREAVQREVANNLGTFQYRLDGSVCVNRRLDELEAWMASGRSGRLRTLVRPIDTPTSLSIETSVWESRDADLFARMPVDERLALGRL